jgi:hypothetical protein
LGNPQHIRAFGAQVQEHAEGVDFPVIVEIEVKPAAENRDQYPAAVHQKTTGLLRASALIGVHLRT